MTDAQAWLMVAAILGAAGWINPRAAFMALCIVASAVALAGFWP